MQVATSDVFDRTAEQEVAVDVAADPLSPRTLVIGGLVLLVVLLALALVARRLWRRRQERRDGSSRPGTGRGGPGRPCAPTSAPRPPGSRSTRTSPVWRPSHAAPCPTTSSCPTASSLEPGETALWSAGARLLVASGHENADTLLVGERGTVVVTDRRLAFVGSTPRDWWLADVDRLRHLDHERTVVSLRDSDDWAGVSYGAQVTRQYLDLALARVQGASYAGIVDRGLRDHELRRPDASRLTAGLRFVTRSQQLVPTVGAMSSQPHVVVLFGATGDLSRRKLLPGLLHLFQAGLLDDTRIIGSSLDEMDDEEFVALARKACEESKGEGGQRTVGRVRLDALLRAPAGGRRGPGRGGRSGASATCRPRARCSGCTT